MDPTLNIIEVARVTPQDSNASLSLPLTFFDLFWLMLRPIERVLFYRSTDTTRLFFDSVIVPNLKSSLSLSLSHYLPFAGQLIWDPLEPKPSIVYSPSDAVSFTVAESNADFTRLSGNKPFSSIELHPLVPELRASDDSASIVSFQVTYFPSQGFSIGMSAHHAVSDGKTTTNFLKSWAHTCNHLLQDQTLNPSLPQDLVPTYDRTAIKDPTDMETTILNVLAKVFSGRKSLKFLPSPEIGPDVVRYTLELSREDIQNLRERLKRESPKELRLSTFVVAYSYALTCLVKARGGDPNRPVWYVFAVDCRNLVDSPIPLSYFGNCVSGSFDMSLTAEAFMGEQGFLTAATLVSDAVTGLDNNVVLNISGLLKLFMNAAPGTQILSVTGSNRFGVYGLDFRWGKPNKVAVLSIDHGDSISMAESRDGTGGVEIGFSLHKHEMDLLIDLLHHELNN